MIRPTGILATAVMVATLACSPETSGPQYQIVPSIIDGVDPTDPQVNLTEHLGLVTFSVLTYGQSCNLPGDQEVEVNGLDVVVRPWDYAPLEGGLCSGPYEQFDHTIQLTIGEAGNLLVILYGRDLATGDIVSFEYVITIEGP